MTPHFTTRLQYHTVPNLDDLKFLVMALPAAHLRIIIVRYFERENDYKNVLEPPSTASSAGQQAQFNALSFALRIHGVHIDASLPMIVSKRYNRNGTVWVWLDATTEP